MMPYEQEIRDMRNNRKRIQEWCPAIFRLNLNTLPLYTSSSHK